jgi:N6-L-threonylcarbamoyladenine synthase
MIILGIEGTAHTFGIGLIDIKKDKVLFNEKVQFKGDEGMDLRKLSEFHVANFHLVLDKLEVFFENEKISFKDIELISFSQGPGLGNSLKIAALVAKTLSLKYKIPIVGVNHIKSHLEIGKFFTKFKDPMFLYVSGVNTQIIAKDEFKNYRVYGETEDIGLGNLIDSFARLLGLGFPGGLAIEERAKLSKNYIPLPFTIKGMNVSFAGLYSNLKKKLNEEYDVNDLCYSLQETCFATMMEVVERAMAYTKKKEFIIVGGVASNKRLSEMAREMCKLRSAKYDSFPREYCVDNGAMIAYQGYVDRKRASLDIKNLKPTPYITIESQI